MKNFNKGSTTLLLVTIVALLVIGGGIYVYYNNVSSTAIPTTQPVTAKQNPDLLTYDNLGISFQYPVSWGVPSEDLYGNGLGSISFDSDSDSVDGQSFAVFIEQDTNPQGTGILNETFDQMISRFLVNDKYIYDTKNITADGVNGRELFYNSAVSGEPYHVEAIFPFKNGSNVSFGVDYSAVPQSVFDSIIATLKWDNATNLQKDLTTGMNIYSNNGIRLEYPGEFDTDYASLNLRTSVQKADISKLDKNGCPPGQASEKTGDSASASTLMIGGTKFCYSVGEGAAMGRSYTTYSYATVRGGNIYTIDYAVSSPNGCDRYDSGPKYDGCLDFQKNVDSLVTKPIQQSISTFSFTTK